MCIVYTRARARLHADLKDRSERDPRASILAPFRKGHTRSHARSAPIESAFSACSLFLALSRSLSRAIESRCRSPSARSRLTFDDSTGISRTNLCAKREVCGKKIADRLRCPGVISTFPPLAAPRSLSLAYRSRRRAMNNELLFHASEMLVISHEISIFGYEEITGPRPRRVRCARQRRDEISARVIISRKRWQLRARARRPRRSARVL